MNVPLTQLFYQKSLTECCKSLRSRVSSSFQRQQSLAPGEEWVLPPFPLEKVVLSSKTTQASHGHKDSMAPPPVIVCSFFISVYLSPLYTQRGARAPDPEIKSLACFWVSQPGAPKYMHLKCYLPSHPQKMKHHVYLAFIKKCLFKPTLNANGDSGKSGRRNWESDHKAVQASLIPFLSKETQLPYGKRGHVKFHGASLLPQLARFTRAVVAGSWQSCTRKYSEAPRSHKTEVNLLTPRTQVKHPSLKRQVSGEPATHRSWWWGEGLALKQKNLLMTSHRASELLETQMRSEGWIGLSEWVNAHENCVSCVNSIKRSLS